MEHVQSKLDQAEVADIIMSQKIAGLTGPSWTQVSVPAVFCQCFCFVLAVAIDAT